MCSEMLRVLGEQATAASSGESAGLRLVGHPNTSLPTPRDEETSS
jgi:hypothetical protein